VRPIPPFPQFFLRKCWGDLFSGDRGGGWLSRSSDHRGSGFGRSGVGTMATPGSAMKVRVVWGLGGSDLGCGSSPCFWDLVLYRWLLMNE
jgi:hypothetical protein